MLGYKRIVALLIALFFFAAACSSTSDSESASDKSNEDGTEQEQTSTTADDEDMKDGDDKSDDDMDDDMDDAMDDEVGPCVALAGSMGDFMKDGAMALGADPEDFDELDDAMEKFNMNVPDEIAEDVEIFTDAWNEFAGSMATMMDEDGIDLGNLDDLSDLEDLRDLESLAAPFESPEVQEAMDNIEAWVDENCN